MVHQLKLAGMDLANAVNEEDKTFEIRLNDRGYQVGDMLLQSLWDGVAKQFVSHDVSSQCFLVTYVSTIEFDCKEHVVMGLHRAVTARTVLMALADKFRLTETVCSVITFGMQYDNVKIVHLGVDTIAIRNEDGKDEFLNVHNVVWIVPNKEFTEETRSVSYSDLDFWPQVSEDDFQTKHHYDIFMKRVRESYD